MGRKGQQAKGKNRQKRGEVSESARRVLLTHRAAESAIKKDRRLKKT